MEVIYVTIPEVMVTILFGAMLAHEDICLKWDEMPSIDIYPSPKSNNSFR